MTRFESKAVPRPGRTPLRGKATSRSRGYSAGWSAECRALRERAGGQVRSSCEREQLLGQIGQRGATKGIDHRDGA